MEKPDNTPEVVVVTRTSAGIGRATAREFAEHGTRVGLIARGRDGLEEARREVEAAGGEALVLETDVADAEAVEAAARRVEEELGPIDVWVNDAIAIVFAPFTEIRPDDFKRSTEVCYLGPRARRALEPGAGRGARGSRDPGLRPRTQRLRTGLRQRRPRRRVAVAASRRLCRLRRRAHDPHHRCDREDLDDDGLLKRFRTDGAREGAFLACSFWLVECLAYQRRIEEARKVFDRTLAAGNDLGLFSEEYDTIGSELLGNFPQGLSHLSHIMAALALADMQSSR